MQRTIHLIKENSIVWYILFLCIFAIALLLRFQVFGDPRLSIGGSDTNSFLQSSRYKLFSYEFFTARRTPTMSIFLKIFEPKSGYELTTVSEPASSEPSASERMIQPGLDRFAFFQVTLSIFSWGLLAFVLFWYLKTPILKLLVSAFVLFFASVPQLAAWDSILLSESVSFSFFALMLAITIVLSFQFINEGRKLSKWTYVLFAGWLVVFTLWVFTRDSNAYLIPLTIVFIGGLIVYGVLKKSINIYPLIVSSIFLIGVFYFHNITLKASDRWLNPFIQNMKVHVEPYDTRVAFFVDHGMPLEDPEDDFTYELFKTGEMREWVYSRGYDTYTLFLLDNPRWTVQKVIGDLENAFSENMQPYFRLDLSRSPEWLLPLGNMLHPTSSSALLIDILFTSFILSYALIKSSKNGMIWAGLTGWLLFGEMLLFTVAYHGDPYALIRHTLVATMPMRLTMWILPVVLFDMVISRENIREVE